MSKITSSSLNRGGFEGVEFIVLLVLPEERPVLVNMCSRSVLLGRNCGRRRGSRAALSAQIARVAWYPCEAYICVGKCGEENVDALNNRVVG